MPIEDPSGHALDAFFARLARTDRQEAGAVTRILHYGDSTIASDYVSGTVRRRLQARFGDAGHGFILIANPWEWYFHNDVLHASNADWKASRLAGPVAPDGMYGLGGVSFTSYGGGVAAFGTAHARRLRSQRLALRSLLPRATRRGRRRAHGARRGARALLDAREREGLARPLGANAPTASRGSRVRAVGGGPVRLFGVALERDEPGVVYDALGSHAAMAAALATAGPRPLEGPARAARRGARRLPVRHQRERSPEVRSRPSTSALSAISIDELREAASGASILVVAPLDRAEYEGRPARDQARHPRSRLDPAARRARRTAPRSGTPSRRWAARARWRRWVQDAPAARRRRPDPPHAREAPKCSATC